MEKKPKKSPPPCPRCGPLPSGTKARVQAYGVFRRPSNGLVIQRYKCFGCERTFSDTTLTHEYRQRKRDINEKLFKQLVSLTSMRRSAILIGVSRKTVERRIPYFAKVSKDWQKKFLESRQPVTEVVFDDMESSIHTKLKPVSIPMAVEKSSRLILSYDVVSMPAKGPLAQISVAKYGKRPDDRKKGWKSVITTIHNISAEKLEILSDSHKMYPSQIRCYVPKALHKTVLSRRACVAGQGELKTGGFDPMFSFNHTAAMTRANINRLIRQTWCTSKKIENLHAHFGMYQMWHNEGILAKGKLKNIILPFPVVA